VGYSRYRGRGVLIYWHVEKKSMAVHSHLGTAAPLPCLAAKSVRTRLSKPLALASHRSNWTNDR
jgi:hypothetical protein